MLEDHDFILFPTVPIKTSGSTQKGPPTVTITPIISANFEAKRNAAKIYSYFINSRFFVKRVIAYAIFVAIVIAISNVNKGSLTRKSTRIFDDRTTRILISLGVTASVKVNQVLNRSVFFSKLFADILNEPSIVDINQLNAWDIELMLSASKQESDDLVFWWDIATEDGEYFSLENGRNDTVRAIGYGNSNKTTMTGYLNYWFIDKDFPPYGFPWYEENLSTDYCFFDKIWYYYVAQLNKSSWIGPYIDTIEGEPRAMLSFSAPFYSDSKFYGITSHTVSPFALHDVLYDVTPSNNSRLLLLDNTSFVLASSTDLIPMEVIDTNIVNVDMTSLDDPVWTCALNNANDTHSLPNNFTCNIEGSQKSYFLSVEHVYLEDGKRWNLICAVCLNDFTGTFFKKTQKSSQITNILIMFAITTTAVFFMLRHTILSHFKRNIVNWQTMRNRKLFEIDQIIHQTTNKVIIAQFKHIYADLVSCYQTLFYASPNLLQTINNKSLRDVIVEKFGIPVTHESSSLTFRRLDLKSKTLFRGGQTANVTIDRDFIKVDHFPYVINAFIEVNSNLLFSNEELAYLLKQIFYGFDEIYFAFVADSFNLIGFFLTKGLPSIYLNCDLTFSIYFTLLLFHKLMAKRFVDKRIPYRYFLEETEEIYTETDNLLENFKNIKIKKVEYDFKRWKKIVNTIISLLPALFVSEQISIPKTFRYIIKRRSGVLFKNEELMCLSCLLIVGQYSYFFHSREYTQVFLDSIRNIDVPVDRFAAFEETIKVEFLRDAVISLSTVIEPSVFSGLLDNLNIAL